jgi:hypothetical protein
MITFDLGLTTLTITNVIIEDTGEYICKAVNPLGEGVTKTFLRIKRKYMLDTYFVHLEFCIEFLSCD